MGFDKIYYLNSFEISAKAAPAQLVKDALPEKQFADLLKLSHQTELGRLQ